MTRRQRTAEQVAIAKRNGICSATYYNRINRGWSVERAISEKPAKCHVPVRNNRECAIYKGEDLLADGTVDEVAEQLGISRETVLFYGTPAYAKRNAKRGAKNARELVWLDDDE